MNWRNIINYEDIIAYSKEIGCNFFNEDRVKEHRTEIFKTFLKTENIILIKLRELESISGRLTGKCIFRVCSMKPDGAVEIENNFKNKKELQNYYNNKKDEIKNKN